MGGGYREGELARVDCGTCIRSNEIAWRIDGGLNFYFCANSWKLDQSARGLRLTLAPADVPPAPRVCEVWCWLAAEHNVNHNNGGPVGFITDNWLKGTVERNREHRPTEVAVGVGVPSGEWESSHGVEALIHASSSADTYKTLYLTQADIGAVVPYLVSRATRKIQNDAVIVALADCSDKELSKVLEELFLRRRARR